MLHTFRLLPPLALLLSLCLASNADAAAEPAHFPASFVASGLLLKPEETLLRAHGYDARAMTLVGVGYALGIGGFPQEHDLAASWARQLYFLGVEGSILSPILQEQAAHKHGGPLSAEQLGDMAAGCASARKDATASLFQEAGIFDLEAFCAKVEVRKRDLPGWEESYSELLKRSRTFQAQIQKIIRLARELRSRPATATERELLLKEVVIPRDVWLFFAATDHDPATQAPDWNAGRLLTFVEAQLPAPKSKEASYDWAPYYLAGEALVDGLVQNPGDAAKASELMRRAHAGEPDAMRLMALHYRDGSLGFIRDKYLELAWLQRAALESGDAESMLLLAVELLRDGNLDAAWAWAEIVDTAGNPDERTKYLAGRLTKMIDARYGDETGAKGQELALSYLDERKARKDRRDGRTAGEPTPKAK